MRPQIVKILTPVLLLSTVATLAQAKEPPPPDRSPDPPIDLNIDSGLILLLVAGLILGTYYFFQLKKKRVNS